MEAGITKSVWELKDLLNGLRSKATVSDVGGHTSRRPLLHKPEPTLNGRASFGSAAYPQRTRSRTDSLKDKFLP